MRCPRAGRLALAGVACAALTPHPAGAQVAGAAPRERIVVTASGQAEAERGAGVSVFRLEAEELARLGADHPAEALNRGPGVMLHRGSGQEHLTAVRSPVLTAGAGAGSFLFLEDGVALRAPGFSNVNSLAEAATELASAIEVIRGPGTALHGSNAVHGVINVLTPSGDVDGTRWDGTRWRASVGSLGRRDVGFTTGLAGHRKAQSRFLIGLDARTDAGWRAASGYDQIKALARAGADFGNWTADASFTIADLDQETAGFVRGSDAYRDPALYRTNPNPEAFRNLSSARAHVRLEHRNPADAGGGVTVLTPYVRDVETVFLQHFLPSQALEDNRHQSAGVMTTHHRALGPSWDAVFGLDLDATRGELKEIQDRPSFGSFPQGVHYDYVVDAAVAAAYVRATRRLSPRLKLVGDLRSEWVRYDYDNRTDSDTVGRFQRPADRRDTFSFANPGLSVVAQLSDRTTTFARLARGARAPQTSDLYRLQSRQEVGASGVKDITSVEAGVRHVGANFSGEITVFDMVKTGVTFRDADGFTVTGAETDHAGIEIAGDYAVTPSLTVSLSATRARHVYGFTRPVTVNATESVRSGDLIDTAPELIANGRITWAMSHAWRGQLEWVHVGDYAMDAANTQFYPGHDVFNVRVSRALAAGLEADLVVRNAANVRYAERADFSFGSERYFPGEERAVTLRLRGAF